MSSSLEPTGFFFYGTLMSSAILNRVIYGPSPPRYSYLRIQPAILPEFTRRKVQGADYPGIVPAPGSSVKGTFVIGLREDHVRKLDFFEGDDYERRNVPVKVLNEEGGEEEGEEVQAEAYVWIAGVEGLREEEWSYEEFVREKLGRWVGEEGKEEYRGR
ncbi:hypothetical protein EX30DRAFT_109658 [Ascodesmis nigricans]|uniref:Putative gamma-glutamylcyclotransferase n=1 Tax=Ascodesmis nigricans TaxID=341454 RepID=A0A4S2MQJ6_9PEZI|nr:hypothetical protein EX30DRAFT_109658 [Ascodesmis nigricans]